MSERKLEPKRRFKGFSGEWEEKKLGEVVILYGGNSFDSVFSQKIGVRWLKIANVSLGEISWLESSYLPLDFWDKYKEYQLVSGDYVMALTRPVLNGNLKIAQLKDSALLNQRVAKLIFLINSAFGFQILRRNTVVSNIESEIAGTDPPNLSTNTFNKINIKIPELIEQTKIGDFFKQLDQLIRLQQKKQDKLKALKQAYLFEMFPSDGEKVPKRRFKGFSGDWEEKKFGDIVTIVGGGTPSTEVKEYWNGNINWYSPVEIGTTVYTYGSQKKITQLGLEKSSAKILSKDITILFTSRAGIGDMAILKCNAATNQGFQSFVVNKEIDVYFIYSYGHEIKRYAFKNASGSTFLEISGKLLEEMPLTIPTLPEQTLIGNFFKHLDDQINHQQRKLTKLQDLKKAYLNEMFI